MHHALLLNNTPCIIEGYDSVHLTHDDDDDDDTVPLMKVGVLNLKQAFL